MANISVNTKSATYQERLRQFREIKDFYKPKIVEYHKLNDEQQTAWRQADPILWELLDFARRVDRNQQRSEL